MLDPPFNWNIFHPHVLKSYGDRHPTLAPANLAAWRAQNHHNIHARIPELTRNPDESFHPVWHELWKLKKEVGVRDPGRSFVEELLLQDIFDAISLYDIYSGSVSVFFTHNGRLQPGVCHTPVNVLPQSYISPRFLFNRMPTELSSSEPFSVMLQIFISTFTIPHAQAFETVVTQKGYLLDLAQRSQPERKSWEWPYLQKYDDSTLLQLNGWNPSNIPSSMGDILSSVFPSLMYNPTSSPVPNDLSQNSRPPSPSSYFQPLHEKLASLTVDDSCSSMLSTSFNVTTSSTNCRLNWVRSQLKQLESQQLQLQEEISVLTRRLQLIDDEVVRYWSIIEDIESDCGKTQLRSAHSELLEPQASMPCTSHSFGRQTAALFKVWQFDPECHSILFRIVSLSQTEAEWWKYLQISFKLSEDQQKELLYAMREDYIITQLQLTSQNLQVEDSPGSSRLV